MYLSNVNNNKTKTPKVIQKNESQKSQDSSFNQLFQIIIKMNQ